MRKFFVSYKDHSLFGHKLFLWVIFGLIFLAFVFVKIQIFNLDQDQIFPDTKSYAIVADAPLFQKPFWAHERPFTYPLLFKALGIRGEFYLIPEDAFSKATLFQIAFSIVCWTSLGLSIALTIKSRWLKWIAFLVILLFALSLDISQWDRILITESVATSLFALLIGLMSMGLKMWEEFDKSNIYTLLLYAVGFLGITTLFSFSRDVNGYLILMCALLLLLGLIPRRSSRIPASIIALSVASLMLGVFIIQNKSADVGRRWLGPFWNVFYARILPNETALSYFVQEGLPLDTDTQQALQELDRRDFLKLRDDPKYKPMVDWIRDNGKSTYIKLLLINPLHSMRLPLDYTHQLISPDSSEYRRTTRPTPRWSSQMSNIMYPKTTEFLLIGLLVLGILTLITAWIQFLRPWWLVPWFLLLTAYPLMFIIYHGDAIELERHAMQVGLQLRLAGWMMLVYLLDAWVLNSYPKATR